MATNEDAFMSRWARRKNAAATGAPEPELAELEEQAAQQAVEEQAEQDAAAVAEAERMAENRAAAEAVDLETVDEATDFKIFMKEGVPTALRQMALKKLWRIHPIFGVLDGLNDYDHDYNVIDTVLTKFESAWKIGKGYAKKTPEEVEEMIEAGKARAEAARHAELEVEAAESEKPEGADAEAEVSAVEPADEALETDDQTAIENSDVSNETVEAADFEEEAPRRIPLRRRFALDEWSEG